MKPSYLPESDSDDELPPGWEEKTSVDGVVSYVNVQKNIKQWTHPRTGRAKRLTGELPIGWEMSVEPDTNRKVFYNKQTNQSTYIDPRLAFAIEDAPVDVSQVRQRYDASTTALQVLHGKDLKGRIAVITGANCGIGFETARSLVLHGCEVIFACRNRDEALKAVVSIANERPTARNRCHIEELDLSNFKSVLNFVRAIKQKIQHIDYLFLNAGVFALPYSLTIDGFETTFQVSHLAHFYITNQLLPLFDHTTRIIVVSSESHRYANLPADGLTEQHLSPPPDKYWSMMAYNNAKLCNVLFAQELAKRWRRRGICVYVLHPGNMISTKLSRNWWFYRFIFAFVRPFTKSLQQGAATSVYCAVANELAGVTGLYFNNCYICEPSQLSQKENLRKKLWELSERMVQSILENPLNKYDRQSPDSN